MKNLTKIILNTGTFRDSTKHVLEKLVILFNKNDQEGLIEVMKQHPELLQVFKQEMFVKFIKFNKGGKKFSQDVLEKSPDQEEGNLLIPSTQKARESGLTLLQESLAYKTILKQGLGKVIVGDPEFKTDFFIVPHRPSMGFKAIDKVYAVDEYTPQLPRISENITNWKRNRDSVLFSKKSSLEDVKEQNKEGFKVLIKKNKLENLQLDSEFELKTMVVVSHGYNNELPLLPSDYNSKLKGISSLIEEKGIMLVDNTLEVRDKMDLQESIELKSSLERVIETEGGIGEELSIDFSSKESDWTCPVNYSIFKEKQKELQDQVMVSLSSIDDLR